jgi:hypothetical protein
MIHKAACAALTGAVLGYRLIPAPVRGFVFGTMMGGRHVSTSHLSLGQLRAGSIRGAFTASKSWLDNPW